MRVRLRTTLTLGLWLCCALGLLSACARHTPPPELAGLWSAGPAACEAGVGVRFKSEAVAAMYEDGARETLFQSPTYHLLAGGENFRVRIRYELPRLPGGARSVGAYGVLVLKRGETGLLEPVSHNLIDARTGSARLRMVGDPAIRSLRLTPCGPHPWSAVGLRGRDA